MAYTFCEMTFSDLHKDVYGSRPAPYHNFYEASDDMKQMIWDDLCKQLEINEKAARKLEKERVAMFDARIQDVISLGAGDRKTALRWIASQETFYHGQDVEHFVWELGVLFTDYGRKLVEELAEVVEYEETDLFETDTGDLGIWSEFAYEELENNLSAA